MHDLRMVAPAAASWGVAAWLATTDSRLALSVGLATMVLAAIGWKRAVPLAVVSLCVAGVAISCAWKLAAVEASPVTQVAETRGTATVELQVRGDPRGFEQHGQAAAVVPVVVHRIMHRGHNLRVRVRAVAFIRGDVDDLSVGRRFEALGRLAPSETPTEAALISVIRRGSSGEAAWWWDGSDVVRDGVRTAVAGLDDEPRALIPALVMGDGSELDERTQDDFRRSGLTHLLAVSGTNLTIVLVTVLMVGRALGMGRRSMTIAGLLSVVGFVLLARPDPSVLRAAAMGVVGIAGVEFGGRGGLRALAWAVIALLFIDPWLGRSVGFVLSVCATAGIVVLAAPLARSLGTWLPRWCALAVAVPVSAQLACTPTIAAISGEVSLVAVAANVAAAPAVAPATIAGLAGGLMAVVWVPLGHIAGHLAGWCAQWILAVGHRAANLDGAAVPWPLSWLVLLLATPFLALVTLKLARRPVVVIGLCVGLMVAMWRPPMPGWPPDDWVMVVCDVGQGSAYVVNGGGATMLVDAGPDPSAADRCLRRLGIDQLDLVVFTHRHADHIDGWPGVVQHRDVDSVVVGPSGGPDGLSASPHRAVAGESWSLGESTVEVVWPTADAVAVDRGADGTTMNNASVVLRVRSPEWTAMLTGDVEPEAQDAIVRLGVDLRADVMTVPHHGSARQSAAFVEKVGPSVAIVSSGADNDYGHPAATAMTLLRSNGVAVWRTDLQGDVAVVRRDGRPVVLTR